MASQSPVTEQAEELCRAVFSNLVDERGLSVLQAAFPTCSSLRLALGDVLKGCVSLTSDLLVLGPLTLLLYPARHSCAGRVTAKGKPVMLEVGEGSLQPGIQDLEAITRGEPGSCAFFCVPILHPRPPAGPAGAPAVGALLLQFAFASTVALTELKAGLLLANELSQQHAASLQSFARGVAAVLSPPGHGEPLGEGPEEGEEAGEAAAGPGSSSSTSASLSGLSDYEGYGGEDSDAYSGDEGAPHYSSGDEAASMDTEELEREAELAAEELERAQAAAAEVVAEARRARRQAAGRLLQGMHWASLRFAQPAAEAEYGEWRHRHLVQSDVVRLAGLVLLMLSMTAFSYLVNFGAAISSCLITQALLSVPLALRLLPATRGWYARWRNWLLAATFLARPLQRWLVLPALLGALPGGAWQERSMKVMLLWMMATGTALQIRYPQHVLLLALATATWVPTQAQVCPIVRPEEWFPGCVVIGACKALCCQLLLPLGAAYFSELGERRLWANTVWEGHPHQE